MKKLFITGIIWEIVRFTILYLAAATKISGDLILFFTSQQLIIFYIYFFLLLDTEKYAQYLKILSGAKFLSLFTGFLYIIKMLFSSSVSMSDVLSPANVVIIDGVFFAVLLIVTIKYFQKPSETIEE